MPNFRASLDMAIKEKAPKIACPPFSYFKYQIIKSLIRTAYIPGIYYHTAFLEPELSDSDAAPISQICVSAILLLPIVRN
jgi:hypothetical protein